jgi:hypothetical protein
MFLFLALRNLLIKTHKMGNLENCSKHTCQNLEDFVNMKKKCINKTFIMIWAITLTRTPRLSGICCLVQSCRTELNESVIKLLSLKSVIMKSIILFLNIWLETRIRILNGRTTGDLNGQPTCITYNGSSLVNYTPISEELLQSVGYFEVHDLNPLSNCYFWNL